MKIFLTSTMGCYYKDSLGNRYPQKFSNTNGLYDNLKNSIKKYDNFLFIASSELNDITDMYASYIFKSFELTLPFKNYNVLDNRNLNKAKQLIQSADLIFLCGGHVPTQNALFKKLKLKNLIINTDAVIIGTSAGSMNMADIVYAQPEKDGEYKDKNYKRYISGLNLVKFNIIPHYEELINDYLDGVSIKKICKEDSYNRPFIAYSDGAYILQNDNKQYMYGKAYVYKNGKRKKISNDGSITDITKLLINLYKDL